MKKRTLIICIILAMVAGCLTGTLATMSALKVYRVNLTNYAGSNTKLNIIWSMVEQNYVDRLDNDSVLDRIYATMISSLDPHSRYLSSEEMAREEESIRGNFDGVGIVLRIVDDTVYAMQLIPGGPSEKAGILPGDKILSVDGILLSGVKMPNDEVVSHLRGPRGSIADIRIMRHGDNKPRMIKVTRGVIPSNSIAYSGMLDKKTGYIRISQFSGNTYNEFCKAVTNLRKQGMQRMVLDLRDNGGGLLSTALDICDELLPSREVIVYTEGAHQKREVTRSNPGGLFCTGELVVMIDEFSASASEIIAGAIQDNDRGIIVGRRSFGKGLVQQEFLLPGNSAMMLTISRYYTPSGRCIQRPYDKGNDEYYADFINSLNENYDSDSLLTTIIDSTKYYTTKGRIVYGGGGIYPDHTIGYRKEADIAYYALLLNKGILSRFAIKEVSVHGREITSQYPTVDDYVKKYSVTDGMIADLVKMGTEGGVPVSGKGLERYRNEIKSRLKAEIGEMLYGPQTFYLVHLWTDNEVQEARKYFK